MIQYSDEQKEIIRNYNSKKNLTIKFLDDDSFGDINGDRIYWESLNLIESLCDSDNLIFGSCESSEMQIQVADVPLDIKNHEIQLDLIVDEIPVPLGIFFIADVEKATDKRYKKLKCYDRMYYMQTDVIEWYNSIFPTTETTMTLKEFRDSFFNWMGLEQKEDTLINDNMIIRKTIDATELSGLDVIKAICEINGAFGHFNRHGIFQYVYLDNDSVYPSETLYPRDDLYPGGGELEQVSNAYYIPPSEQNDYIVRNINKLQIRQEDGDIGAIVTSKWYTEEESNSYIVNSNFLVYGNSAEELDNIAKNLSTKIFGITYTPNSTNAVAMPYMEVGDGFYVSSSKTPFTSYILKRTLSGIQGMRDLWEAKGDEFQPEIVSGSNQEIIQLRSRVNILTRTVDENKLEISRVETDLKGNYSTTTEMNSAITQSANNITLTVSNQVTETKKYADSVASTAERNAKNDTANKLLEYSTTVEMKSAIEISANNITQTVASAQSKWSTIDENGNKVTISEYGYGLDGSITGSNYIFSDSLNVGEIYLDQVTGYGWQCTSVSSIGGKRVAIFGYRPAYVFTLITNELNSKIEQTANDITLSVSETYETKNNADSQYKALSSSISANAEQIELKVSSDSIISTINQSAEQVTIDASKINLTGYVTVSSLSGEGQTTINGANITTGTIKGVSIELNSGMVAGLNVDSNGLFYVDYDNRQGAGIQGYNAFDRDAEGNPKPISDHYAFWAGGGGIGTADKKNAEFYVKYNGEVMCRNIHIDTSNTNDDQIIRMVYRDSEGNVISETGIKPSQFFIHGQDGFTTQMSNNGFLLRYNGEDIFSIISTGDGVIYYNAKSSHEFPQNVIFQSNFGFAYNGEYIDIRKTLIDARNNERISFVNFDGKYV